VLFSRLALRQSHAAHLDYLLMSENFADLFEEYERQSNLKIGAIITGTVVAIRNDTVVINAGLKSEAVLPIEHFRDESGALEVKVGDDVKVALESLEDGTGETKLSREKAKRSLVWD
jgi:small subunit ribosomal protein S1